MSASDPDSKIDILETPEAVKKKLKKAYAAPKEVTGNGLISFVEYVLLPVSALKTEGKGKFVVERREGEPLVYDNIETLKDDYTADTVSHWSGALSGQTPCGSSCNLYLFAVCAM